VQCSPQRLLRPWDGQRESTGSSSSGPEATYDPTCKLCPGNERSSGVRNPQYVNTFVFTNDFPAIYPPDEQPNIPPFTNTQAARKEGKSKDIFIAENTDGLCKVICFSPLHTKTLPQLTVPQVRAVIDVWATEYEELSKLPYLRYATFFENKGAVMGCSNPHPHCQVWSTSFIPDDPARELENCRKWKKDHGTCLLCDYVQEELQQNERIVVKNASFVALVPYWATWPFETLVVSTRHATSLVELTDTERTDLAQLLKNLLTRYDNLFETSFPYSGGMHQLPFHASEEEKEITHLHFHYLPPLLRSATVKKFMVGFELLANSQRDLTAENAAQQLASQSDVLYKDKN